jgi:hypothetical protein
MTPAIEKPASSKLYSGKIDFSRNRPPDASYPGSIWDVGRFRSPEDEIVLRRWRLRFFIFYGAIALLLVGGLAIVADRPGTGTLTASSTK